MPKCLVTGAAGFIGSCLSEELLKLGFEVTGVDAFRDYYPRRTKLSNIQAMKGDPRFRFLELDLAVADLTDLVKRSEYIFHLAAQPGVRASWGKTFSYYVTDNIIATQRLLETAKHSSPKRIVFASSSSIYGDSEQLPTPEDATPKPNSPYGVTKLASENLCRTYHNNFGLPTVTLRYFTVYGPRQRPDMAFNIFIRKINSGDPIKIFGDGSQARDFTYVDDIVAGTILAINGESGKVFNLGSGRTVSLNEAVGQIESFVGKEAVVEHVPPAAGDVGRTSADISLAREELGYAPGTSLKKGIEKQARWQLER